MKNVATIILLFIGFSAFSQDLILMKSGDTLRGTINSEDDYSIRLTRMDGKKTMVSKDIIIKTIKAERFNSNQEAGEYLVSAANKTFGGLAIVLISGVVTTLGVALAPTIAVPLAIVGGVGILIGNAVCISAWKKIQLAGEVLKKSKS